MWKRRAALAAAFVVFLFWMLAIGRYGNPTVGLSILSGSFAAYWLTGLQLPAIRFWAVALAMLAAVAISQLLSSADGFWAYAGAFLYGAAAVGPLFSLINRHGPSRRGGRESARA